MSVVERLKQARTMAGLTGSELGKLAGLSGGVVSMIESGNRKDPSGSTVAALARVLGVTADWLLTGSEPDPTEEQVKAAVTAARENKGAA